MIRYYLVLLIAPQVKATVVKFFSTCVYAWVSVTLTYSR